MPLRFLQIILFLFSVTLLSACALANRISPGVSAQSVGEDSSMQMQKAPPRVDKSQFTLAREISSSTWINSETISWNDLRGRVVVVDFWTFACYNCKNTLPYLKAWDQKYRAQGLVVLGVHTPELSFEKDIENVRTAVKDYEIKYPVAIDGDFANWNRYNVWAWPTWFIVDKEGYIRYSHVGEGDYDGSEHVIQQLLAE